MIEILVLAAAGTATTRAGAGNEGLAWCGLADTAANPIGTLVLAHFWRRLHQRVADRR